MKMFSDDWDNLTKVVLYGFGTVGKACIDKMKQDFHVDFMLDRNADKLGGGVWRHSHNQPRGRLGRP